LFTFEVLTQSGSAYLLSCWYKRFELQKRNTVFFLIGMLSSAFSGILGYLFSLLSGHGVQAAYWLGPHYGPTKKAPLTPVSYGPGLSGWRWIFILQGVITVVIGIVGWYFIVDFPELAAKPSKTQKKFLNQDEVDFIVARIEEDRHDVIAEEFNLKSYLSGAMDLKVWGFALIFMFTTTITYAIAYFLPIILKDGMGFSPAAANCLIAPPYVFAGFVMLAFAWAGDKYHIRSPWVIANGVLALIGLPMIGFSTNVGVRYFGKFTPLPQFFLGTSTNISSQVSSSPPPLQTQTSLASSPGKPTTSVANGSALSAVQLSLAREVSAVSLVAPSSGPRTHRLMYRVLLRA
jgi:hypothetical protein